MSTLGLDVSLYSFDCDEELPIYAVELQLTCGESDICTFGGSSAVSGERELHRPKN